ncbi:hypothetical protein F5X68DRAFT_138617 [Plectosphaerella plurivora]|uniref:Fucose-specific lectin n=1 Tax=Plectosphaerella plurivora TaxID=936078 RepID=A0A9P9A9Q5_9PEZI|nr:hypothetical protein F5X68DRAFT_138617 [Plectosphaerella plurivora]
MEVEHYSDLEVVRLSVMIPREKVAISREEAAAAGSTPATPAPAYVAAATATAASTVATTSTPRTLTQVSDDGSSVFTAKPLPKEPKRIMGMKKKTFLLLAVGSALLLITALAVALGISLNSRHSVPIDAVTNITNPTNSESTVESDPGRVLSTSNIAALNWTDSANIDRAAVFYQDSSNALAVMLFDSLSGNWMYRNVTASVMNSSSIPSLDVRPGTPLACVTNRWQVSLYYLRSDNKVGEIYAPDPVKGEWFPGAMSSVLDPQASANSSLAAYWQICPGCTNTLLVAYQGPDGVQLANHTNDQWQSMSTLSNKITPGSGLTMSPFVDFEGAGPTGTDANALRIYHADSSNLTELISGPLTDNRWETGNFGNAVTSKLPTSPSPDITSLSFGINGWTNTLATYLTSTGTLVSSLWNGTTWATSSPEIVGNTGNFSAIAATQSQLMFGIIDGGIHQFRVDAAKNPFKWYHVNKIAG